MNPFPDIFHAQKVLFASGVSRTYDCAPTSSTAWRA